MYLVREAGKSNVVSIGSSIFRLLCGGDDDDDDDDGGYDDDDGGGGCDDDDGGGGCDDDDDGRIKWFKSKCYAWRLN